MSDYITPGGHRKLGMNAYVGQLVARASASAGGKPEFSPDTVPQETKQRTYGLGAGFPWAIMYQGTDAVDEFSLYNNAGTTPEMWGDTEEERVGNMTAYLLRLVKIKREHW